jgi:hypothetical protein
MTAAKNVAVGVAAAIVAAYGVLRSGGAHGEAAAAPAQSTISAPVATSADIAALRSDFQEARLSERFGTIEKRIDESNAERARQLEQLRAELHVEIRDVKLANAARTDVIARQVQHFEQRFDAAIASPKSKAQAER